MLLGFHRWGPRHQCGITGIWVVQQPRSCSRGPAEMAAFWCATARASTGRTHCVSCKYISSCFCYSTSDMSWTHLLSECCPLVSDVLIHFTWRKALVQVCNVHLLCLSAQAFLLLFSSSPLTSLQLRPSVEQFNVHHLYLSAQAFVLLFSTTNFPAVLATEAWFTSQQLMLKCVYLTFDAFILAFSEAVTCVLPLLMRATFFILLMFLHSWTEIFQTFILNKWWIFLFAI